VSPRDPPPHSSSTIPPFPNCSRTLTRHAPLHILHPFSEPFEPKVKAYGRFTTMTLLELHQTLCSLWTNQPKAPPLLLSRLVTSISRGCLSHDPMANAGQSAL
jgi:hypothetical protein